MEILEHLTEDVSDFWSGAGHVDIINNPTSLHFSSEYVNSWKPVIIRGVMNDWSAIQEWNLDSLCEKCKHHTVSINVTPDGRADAVNGKENKFIYPAETTMSFKNFSNYFTHPESDDAVVYLSSQNGTTLA